MWGSVKQLSRCSRSQCHTLRDQNGCLYAGKRFYSLLERGGYPLGRKTSGMFKLPCIPVDNVSGSKSSSLRYAHSLQNDPDLNRDFFVRLWLADKKKAKPTAMLRSKVRKPGSSDETSIDVRFLPKLLERMLSSKATLDDKSYDKLKLGLKQPPTSQSITGSLKPMSLEEVILFSLFRSHYNENNGVIYLFGVYCSPLLIPVGIVTEIC